MILFLLAISSSVEPNASHIASFTNLKQFSACNGNLFLRLTVLANADGTPESSDVKAAPVQGELPEKTETNLVTEEIEQGKGLYLLERTGLDQGLLKSLQSWSNWHELAEGFAMFSESRQHSQDPEAIH